jgi:type VII secretion protein EccB
MNRIDEALSRQDVRGIGSPLTRMRGTLGIGALGGVLILGAAFVMSIISPKPKNDLAEIVITRNSGRFVQFNGQLHPVTNMASARLIVGKPMEARLISDATLAAMPPGLPMGIPNAPDAMNPRDDTIATWTVCDWHDAAVPLSLLKGGDITTTLIAGRDLLEGGNPLGDDRAVLVKPLSKMDELWLVYRDTRALVGRNDYAAQAALGLTPAHISSALTISPALLQAIPPSPVLTAPLLESRSQLSPAVQGSSIGDILTTGTATGGRAYYLVGRTGVQMIGPVLAQMMVNTGSAQRLVADPATIQNLPRVTVVDDSRFPTKVPTLLNDPALCWQWSKSREELSAHTTVMTASQTPVSATGFRVAVKQLPNNGSEPQATQTVTAPGHGWYVRVTGNNKDSVAEEQIMWIDPSGTAFPIDAVVPDSATNRIDISYDPTVKALGLNFMLPTPIPWAVAKLYAPGATLSIKNAQVLQGQLESVKQVPFPDQKREQRDRAPQYRPENAIDPNSVNPGEAGVPDAGDEDEADQPG